jgi:hypothetical protein
MRKRNGGALGIGAALSQSAQAIVDGKLWAGVGLVVKRQGEDQHYEIGDGDVLVSVDLMPEGQPLWCRLGAGGGGLGGGVLRVPKVGAEVLVLVPRGELEEQPAIVAVLSSGSVDGDLDGDVLLVVNDKKVVIKSTDDQVILGGTSGKEIARKGDAVDIGSWAVTVGGGSVTGIVVTPPGGGAPVNIPVGTPTPLSAKVNAGSSKAKAAD